MLQQEIILFSTHCPLCKGMEKALNNKHISYTLCTDKEKMKEVGIVRVPVLRVGEELLSNKQALKWILAQE